MISRCSKLWVHCAGCGYSRIAPGTVGSLAAALLWPLWILLPANMLLPLWLLLLLLSFLACRSVMRNMTDLDPCWIVIDEALAVWMIPVFYQGQWSHAWLVAWLLFRALDISKPWPISWAERCCPGPIAVLLDDIIAVALALLLTEFWWG